MRGKSNLITLFNGKAANGWSKEINVAEYKDVVLAISTANNANGTIRVAGSILEAGQVNFAAAASATNQWGYLFTYNYLNAVGTAGNTGVVYTGVDGVVMVQVNTDFMETLSVELTGYVAGNFTVQLKAA